MHIITVPVKANVKSVKTNKNRENEIKCWVYSRGGIPRNRCIPWVYEGERLVTTATATAAGRRSKWSGDWRDQTRTSVGAKFGCGHPSWRGSRKRGPTWRWCRPHSDQPHDRPVPRSPAGPAARREREDTASTAELATVLYTNTHDVVDCNTESRDTSKNLGDARLWRYINFVFRIIIIISSMIHNFIFP